jgi:hypothetical protein
MTDDSQYLASNFLKKKDDDSQYLASNFRKKPKEEKKSLLQRAGEDVEQHINRPIEALGRSARNIVGGFGQGIANIAPGLYNLGASGVNALGANVPKSPMIDIIPHGPSETAGEIASFFSPGALFKLLGKTPAFVHTAKSAMKIPMIAEGIKHASNILSKAPVTSRIAGNALLGGAYAPDNQLLGLGLGAAGGALGEVASKGYSGIKNSVKNNEFLKNTVSKFNPEAHAKDLENYLSSGSNNITKNSRQLAQDIKNAHSMRQEEAGIFYNHALKSAGKEPIYGVGHKDIVPTRGPLHAREQETLGKINELNVGEVFDVFKESPTFENAHKLQSELGFIGRTLESNPAKTQEDLLKISKVKSAKAQLQEDINKFLEKRDLTSNQPLSGHYKKASELFEKNVAPFLSNKKLLDIIKGGKTDIKGLHNIFNTPTNVINKAGIEEIGSINKIMQDLPQSSKDRIIFDAIGGNKLTADALLKKLDSIKSKGYESYFTPEVKESINSLTKKMKNVENLKKAGKLAGGATALAIGGNALSHLFQ